MDLVGTGHHSIFDTDNKKLIVYHAHNSSTYVKPRKIYINEISFIENPLYKYDTLEIGNIAAFAISKN